MATPGKKNAIAISWQPVTIAAIRRESPRTKTFRLELAVPWAFLAGQHCSLRLTAPNGYQAARDYSLSSAPASGVYEVTIAHAPHGEVSGWFCTTAEVGDRLEILGPIGRHFIWQPEQLQPVVLIGGGVGMAPLVSILRQHRTLQHPAALSLLYSARSYDDMIFRDELLAPSQANEKIDFTLVDDAPDDWAYQRGLITTAMLQLALLPGAIIYICGPTGFVETAARLLTAELAIDPASIKTEQFG